MVVVVSCMQNGIDVNYLICKVSRMEIKCYLELICTDRYVDWNYGKANKLKSLTPCCLDIGLMYHET